MSGYLVLVYFFLFSPGVLQEKCFETVTLLYLDWKDADWFFMSFPFWLFPKPHQSSVSHFTISGSYFSFSLCP